MRKSILFKLWIGMMSLVVITLFLLWMFQIVFLESFYVNLKVSNIKKEALSIYKLIQDPDRFKEQMDSFSYDNNLHIEITCDDGTNVYETDSNPYTVNSVFSKNQISKGYMQKNRESAKITVLGNALSGKESLTVSEHPRFGNKSILMGIPLPSYGGSYNAMLISLPMAPVDETADILKNQLVVITFIMLAASLVISYIISKMFVRPILKIKSAAGIMASGDFSEEIQITGDDEIGELASTLNRMRIELSKLDKLRKDLISNVSHELRTPLSIIRGYAETIRDISGSDDEKRTRHLKIIIDECDRLSTIVDDILNLSQMQDGIISVDLKEVSLNDVIRDVAERYNILKEKSGVDLNVIPDPQASNSYVLADEARIKQALVNLINNGFNHTPRGGRIDVTSSLQKRDSESFVRVEVSDNGVGIPESSVEHVWDRYYKAENAAAGRTIGTGLGLSIFKVIMEKHSADYGIKSRIGEGTVVRFEIKVAE